jgi:hypothetical protein
MGKENIMGKKSDALAQVDAILGKSKKKQGKGKKNRKIGRYAKSPSCMRYKGERRWERNKVRRMTRQVKRFPSDLQTAKLLAELQ